MPRSSAAGYFTSSFCFFPQSIHFRQAGLAEGFSFLAKRCLDIIEPGFEFLERSPQGRFWIDSQESGNVHQDEEEVSELFSNSSSILESEGLSEFLQLLVQFFQNPLEVGPIETESGSLLG